MSIYTDAKELNIPIDHHESDLYIKQTNDSEKLFCKYRNKYKFGLFISQIDHQLWYDIPFAYEPFWGNKPR